MDRMETESVLCDVRYAARQLQGPFLHGFEEIRRAKDALQRAEALLMANAAPEPAPVGWDHV